MSTSARQRLVRDFKKITNDPPQGINAAPLDSNIMVWQAVIFGPDDTPWEGGTFSLILEMSEEYPNKPPKVRFVSKVYHPNGACVLVCVCVCSLCGERACGTCCGGAPPRGRCSRRSPRSNHPPHPPPFRTPAAVYADGQICLDILQNAWSPIYDVSAVLTSIQSLLCDPNPNSPANSEAARLFVRGRAAAASASAARTSPQALLTPRCPHTPLPSQSENRAEYDGRVRKCVEESWVS